MENFIGIYDNVLSVDKCNEMIDYFELMKKLKYSYTRPELKDGKLHHKDDETVFVMEPELLIRGDNPVIVPFFEVFWEYYDQYTEQFSIIKDSQKHGILNMRLQKTLPGQGYHVWHYEAMSRENAARMMVFSLYLNDVAEGGETEFLYVKKRISPKAGRLMIWPPGFTHTHRGNPPLTEEKYILTGWLEYLG